MYNKKVSMLDNKLPLYFIMCSVRKPFLHKSACIFCNMPNLYGNEINRAKNTSKFAIQASHSMLSIADYLWIKLTYPTNMHFSKYLIYPYGIEKIQQRKKRKSATSKNNREDYDQRQHEKYTKMTTVDLEKAHDTIWINIQNGSPKL